MAITPLENSYNKLRLINKDGKIFTNNYTTSIKTFLEEFDVEKKTMNYRIIIEFIGEYESISKAIETDLKDFIENVTTIELYQKNYDQSKHEFVYDKPFFVETGDFKLNKASRFLGSLFDGSRFFSIEYIASATF